MYVNNLVFTLGWAYHFTISYAQHRPDPALLHTMTFAHDCSISLVYLCLYHTINFGFIIVYNRRISIRFASHSHFIAQTEIWSFYTCWIMLRRMPNHLLFIFNIAAIKVIIKERRTFEVVVCFLFYFQRPSLLTIW